MLFEFANGPDFNFLTSFGQQFGIAVQGDTVIIPPELGHGFIRKIDLGPDFKLLIHQYTFNDEFILKRMPSAHPTDLVSIIFHVNEKSVSLTTPGREVALARNTDFAVQIASDDLESVIRFPAHTPIDFTVMGLSASTLRHLLRIDSPNHTLQTILNETPGFLFYERLGPDVLSILRQITGERRENALASFFYRIKVQELLYRVVEQLLCRDRVTPERGTPDRGRHKTIYQADIDKLFVVRTAILKDLSVSPQLSQLARLVGMSQTKLKDLFKQVFGDSIYAYFQRARMDEAALLLRQGRHSVTDVGYQLGFVNLSHFGRLFRKYYGVNPKTYAGG